MGLFIVFEGVEGSGKSTQARALRQRLASAGISVLSTHEPGGTPTGEQVRQWLKGQHPITPLAELFLFSAARALLVEQVVRPALQAGQTVLCDRYIYSTLAYQGYGRGLDMEAIHQVNRLATCGLLPDLVVLLDLPPDAGLARKSSRALDRFEQEQQDFHRRVRQGYLELSRQEPGRWLVLDASRPREAVAAAIWKRVSGMLGVPQ